MTGELDLTAVDRGRAAVELQVEAAGQRHLLLHVIPVDVKARARDEKSRLRHLPLDAALVAPERVGLDVLDFRERQSRKRAGRKVGLRTAGAKTLGGRGIDHD